MSDGPMEAKFTEPVQADSMSPLDPDRFLDQARKMVVENYNHSYDYELSDPLQLKDVYILWYTKLLKSWKAMIGSTAARRLMWVVTYNGAKSEAYIQVYQRIANIKVADRSRQEGRNNYRD
jgi:Family of unknown function (DUF6275)